MEDKLILLKRRYPTEYEVHRGKISQTHNLVLTTKDEDFAKKLVDGYNSILPEIFKMAEPYCLPETLRLLAEFADKKLNEEQSDILHHEMYSEALRQAEAILSIWNIEK